MSDTLTVILFIVFAVIGGVAGFLITKLTQHTPAGPAQESLPDPDGSIEVLRAWRAPDGRIRLGMDGQKLDQTEALNPDQRRRLVKLVVDLRPWLEAPAPASAAPAPAAPGPAETPAVRPAPVKAGTKPAPLAPKSLVEQINDVLQAKLAGSAFAGQEIELSEGPLGAIVVTVGANQYDSLDAVADPEVKALIKQAVADWEKATGH